MVGEHELKSLIRDVYDFPKPGIVFKDISPLLGNADVRDQVVSSIRSHYENVKVEAVASIEARGFIFGALLAQAFHVPFIPIRKAGKLPFKTIRQSYSLEYGEASLELHIDSVSKGQNVLLHDDLLATGGTSEAAAKLIARLGGQIAGFSFIVNLAFLPGEKLLKERFLVSPHYLLKFT
jgi:adenine phosphoribosyltransferase